MSRSVVRLVIVVAAVGFTAAAIVGFWLSSEMTYAAPTEQSFDGSVEVLLKTDGGRLETLTKYMFWLVVQPMKPGFESNHPRVNYQLMFCGPPKSLDVAFVLAGNARVNQGRVIQPLAGSLVERAANPTRTLCSTPTALGQSFKSFACIPTTLSHPVWF
jgi:hypothetical protein